MSVTKNLADLGKLISVHHGWDAAKRFKAYQMDDADGAKLSFAALEILKLFPSLPASAPALNAAFAVRLAQALDAPVQMIAGSLIVERDRVFDAAQLGPITAFPTEMAADFTGHVWLMVGPYIADISIFRTAYSRYGPPQLSRHIDLMFGPNKGLFVDQWKRCPKMGLRYEPEYVLSEDEVNALMAQAFQIIKEHRDSAQSEG